MNKDEIIRMAREAGLFNQHNEDLLQDKEVMAQFERFADLVAVHAREKLAEQEQVAWEHLGIPSVNGKQTEHEPVKMMNSVGNTEAYMPDQQTAGFNIPLYAAPLAKQDTHATHVVRTKDLTDDEIEQVRKSFGDEVISAVAFSRAVIAAYKEKNK